MNREKKRQKTTQRACHSFERNNMKHSALFIAVLIIIFAAGEAGYGAEPKLPVIKGKKIVAMVNDEPITLDEFNQGRATLEPGHGESPKTSDSEILRRLVNTRLIIQEASKIGIDELPEIKNMVDVYSRVTLRDFLIEKRLKEVKADEKDIERIYKELVREWKINSLQFQSEEAAKKVEEEVKGGGDFGEIAKKRIAEGAAKGGEEKNYLKAKDLHPQIAAIISKMKVGSISSVIPLKTGYIIFQLQDVRFPEDPQAREVAKREALTLKRGDVLKEYNNALIKKYVKVRKDVLDSLDFESKEPGFQELLKDKRVVAEIKGEAPITVGELAEFLRQQLYHGVEKAAESKRLNTRKNPTLDEMLYKRVFRKEAFRLGIDRTEAYKDKVKEYENSVIFGAFVQKAIVPDVKIMEDDLKAYYQAHIKEYAFPEMMKIDSLAFAKRSDAEEAIEKLKKGTGFQWLSANAEGQVDKNAKGLLIFDGKSLATKNLPEGMRKVISGANPGDIKLYASPEGYFYILVIQGVIPSVPQPYEDARKDIGNKVFNEKLKKLLEEFADKLRAISEVKIYLKENE
jgi:hypothetical protein